MADDPFLSPTKASKGGSLAQREFRRREIVRGVVAVFIGLGAVAGLMVFWGAGPMGGHASVGRGETPRSAASAKPKPKPSQPGVLSITEQLLAPPSPLGRGHIDAPFVVPAGQVHRPVVNPADYGRPPRWTPPAQGGYTRPLPVRTARPLPVRPRPNRPLGGNLVPVAPQQRGDALDPPEAPLETTPE